MSDTKPSIRLHTPACGQILASSQRAVHAAAGPTNDSDSSIVVLECLVD